MKFVFRTHTANTVNATKTIYEIMIKPLLIIMSLCLTMLLTKPLQAANGAIAVQMQGWGFYVGARCYTENGADHVGSWKRLSVGLTHRCSTASTDSQPSYMKIQRVNLWGRDRGSVWRVYRPDDCNHKKDFCIYVRGGSLGKSRYETNCNGYLKCY